MIFITGSADPNTVDTQQKPKDRDNSDDNSNDDNEYFDLPPSGLISEFSIDKGIRTKPHNANRDFNLNIKFGLELDFDLRLYFDEDIRFKYLKEILNNKSYFKSSYYLLDAIKRIIYTADRSIILILNFNLIGIPIETLYHMVSVLQLCKLGIITLKEAINYIKTFSVYLGVKVIYRRRRFYSIYRRFIDGKEVETIILELRNDEFIFEFNSQVRNFNLWRPIRSYRKSLPDTS